MLEKRLVRRSFCYASAPPGLGDRKVPRWELPCAPALASASQRSRRTLLGQPPSGLRRSRGSRGGVAAVVAAPHDREERREDEDGDDAAEAQHVHNDRTVFSDLRIVVIAVKENLVHRRADPVAGRFGARQPQVSRRVLDPVEVVRQCSPRRREICGWRSSKRPATGSARRWTRFSFTAITTIRRSENTVRSL